MTWKFQPRIAALALAALPVLATASVMTVVPADMVEAKNKGGNDKGNDRSNDRGNDRGNDRSSDRGNGRDVGNTNRNGSPTS